MSPLPTTQFGCWLRQPATMRRLAPRRFRYITVDGLTSMAMVAPFSFIDCARAIFSALKGAMPPGSSS
jgi:hypothetical protein